MDTFFSSPFWRDVKFTLSQARDMLDLHGVQQSAHVARRLLESRVDCIYQACNQADDETKRRLRSMLAGIEIDSIIDGLLDTLKQAVLIVSTSVGVGAVVGGAFGFLFGGIGAAPGAVVGAAAGAKVGTWILAALGLVDVAEFFIDGLPAVLGSYVDGFNLAWQAGYDEVTAEQLHSRSRQSFQLTVAARRIADGHVAVVMLLLSAIVAYLTRGRGSMQKLAGKAGSGRLGERFGHWLTKHEEALRKHPKLQERPTVPNSAGGSGSPPPPRPPRRDRDAPREPQGPRRMPRKEVRCFGTKNSPTSKIPEFDRQLGGQERGINRMSVDEYLNGREAFKDGTTTRDSSLAKDARDQYAKSLRRQSAQKLETAGMSPREAKSKAAEMAQDRMQTLAALHNPDMGVGGKDAIDDFGDRNVNSRIGAQWSGGKNSRLMDLDRAASEVPEHERSRTLMNSKLTRCP